jgi:hypothetical protein
VKPKTKLSEHGTNLLLEQCFLGYLRFEYGDVSEDGGIWLFALHNSRPIDSKAAVRLEVSMRQQLLFNDRVAVPIAIDVSWLVPGVDIKGLPQSLARIADVKDLQELKFGNVPRGGLSPFNGRVSVALSIGGCLITWLKHKYV